MNRATLAGIGAALRYAFPLPEEPLQWEAGGAEKPSAADSGNRHPLATVSLTPFFHLCLARGRTRNARAR
jgi:hypothetical protein